MVKTEAVVKDEPAAAGTQFNRKKIGLSFVLKKRIESIFIRSRVGRPTQVSRLKSERLTPFTI